MESSTGKSDDDLPIMSSSSASSSSSSPPSPTKKNIQLIYNRRQQGIYLEKERKRFVLFMKILIKHLQRCGENDIIEQIKFIIRFYNNRSQSIMEYQNCVDHCLLIDCMERPIRSIVGEKHWTRAHILMNHYTISPSSTTTKTTNKGMQQMKLERRQQQRIQKAQVQQLCSH